MLENNPAFCFIIQNKVVYLHKENSKCKFRTKKIQSANFAQRNINHKSNESLFFNADQRL